MMHPKFAPPWNGDEHREAIDWIEHVETVGELMSTEDKKVFRKMMLELRR